MSELAPVPISTLPPVAALNAGAVIPAFQDGRAVGITIYNILAAAGGIVEITPWVTATPYSEGQLLSSTDKIYQATVDHISSSIAADLAAGKLVIVVDFSSVVADATAARDAALAAQAGAETAETNSANSAAASAISAVDSAASATAAANSAAVALGAADALQGTSVTSMSTTVGTKNFVTEPNNAFIPGRYVVGIPTADISQYFSGRVVSYDTVSGAIQVDATSAFGGGTFADWNIYISGAPGPAPPVFTGDSGAGGAVGGVPAPAAGDAALDKFLSAAGSWKIAARMPAFSVEAFDALAGTPGHDSSTAIQAAINAAELAKGVVMFQAKEYEIATGLVVDNHNVRLQGVGWTGFIQDNALGTTKWTQAGGTIIKWTGADNAGDVMLSFKSPITGPRLNGVGMDGIILDGAAKATKGLLIQSVQNGWFPRVAVGDCRSVNIHITVMPVTNWTANDPRDCQHCHFGFLFSRAGWITNTLTTTGVLINADSVADVSANTFEEIFYTHKDGVGLQVGSSDWIDFRKVWGFRIPGGTAFGVSLVGGTGTADHPRKHTFHMMQPGPGGLRVTAGVTADVTPKDIEIWYDRGNGTPLPNIDAGCGITVYVSSQDWGLKVKRILRILAANGTGQNVATAQPWFPTGSSITVKANTAYRFRGTLIITRTAGTTAHTTSLLFGGTAAVGNILYSFISNSGLDVLGLNNRTGGSAVVAIAVQVKASDSVATEQIAINVEGIVRITTGGTFIPQFQYSAAPGGVPTIGVNTFFEMEEIGWNDVTEVGGVP